MTHATPTELINRAKALETACRWAGIDEGNMRDEARNLRQLAREASRADLQPAMNHNAKMEAAA